MTLEHMQAELAAIRRVIARLSVSFAGSTVAVARAAPDHADEFTGHQLSALADHIVRSHQEAVAIAVLKREARWLEDHMDAHRAGRLDE